MKLVWLLNSLKTPLFQFLIPLIDESIAVSAYLTKEIDEFRC